MKRFIGVRQLFFLMFILLSGCVAAAFVAGTSAGGLVVSDQRDWKTRSEDSYIEHRLDVNIIQDPQFKTSNLDLSTFDCVVLLVGQVPAASLKVQAEKIAQSTPNVKKVYNEITVGPSISFGQKSEDVWLTSAVKSALLVKSGLRSGSIKVLTENSTVYLMGLVTKEQADLAVDATRRVNGVRNVVKVFEYL